MTTEQFEQAKREFAKTYGGSIVVGFGQPSGSGGRSIETAEEQCLSDLNSLLEQHKEMILREELIAYDNWLVLHELGYEFDSTEQCVDEYLKNVKKS